MYMRLDEQNEHDMKMCNIKRVLECLHKINDQPSRRLDGGRWLGDQYILSFVKILTTKSNRETILGTLS